MHTSESCPSAFTGMNVCRERYTNFIKPEDVLVNVLNFHDRDVQACSKLLKLWV